MGWVIGMSFPGAGFYTALPGQFPGMAAWPSSLTPGQVSAAKGNNKKNPKEGATSQNQTWPTTHLNMSDAEQINNMTANLLSQVNLMAMQLMQKIALQMAKNYQNLSNNMTTAAGAQPIAPSAQTLPSTDGKPSYRAKATGYYPADDPIEGGFKDMRGKPLYTLQDYLEGKAPYVSVAMDNKNSFPYGTKLRIPELEKKYGRKIEFRVVDTGGAFYGKGKSRIDICTRNRSASLDPSVNGTLTLIPV